MLSSTKKHNLSCSPTDHSNAQRTYRRAQLNMVQSNVAEDRSVQFRNNARMRRLVDHVHRLTLGVDVKVIITPPGYFVWRTTSEIYRVVSE
jgi:hypothetical protein